MKSFIFKLIALTVLLMLPAAVCTAQKKYYVNDDGPGLTGTSWGWAANDLQATINKASAGDIVYVAAGIYYGGFVMKEGVEVRGGYTANAANPEERYTMNETDSAHYSILDGKGIQRVLTQLNGFDTPTKWDGFVIQHGNPTLSFSKGSIIYSQNGDNSIAGVLYDYDADTQTGKMLGTQEISKQWGGYESFVSGLPSTLDRTSALADSDGESDTHAICDFLQQNSADFFSLDYSTTGNYAAYWCDTLNTGGFSNWYLPSPAEWQEVKDAGIATILTSMGKDMKYPYWTSAQIENTLAWCYNFGNGYLHPALKYVNHRIVPFHLFEMPENPNSIYTAGGGAFLLMNGILSNCHIIHNYSSSIGGGVYVGAGGKLIDCTVENNDAPEYEDVYYEPYSSVVATHADAIKVYPNPVKAGSSLYVENPCRKPVKYRITDFSGKTALTGTLPAGRNSIAAPAAKGIYLFSIDSEKCAFKIAVE